MTTGIVFDIKKFSLHDGPGIRTTVFLKGCGLRCWWCHNPESQHPQPELLLRPEVCIGCGACLAACPQGAIHQNGAGFVTDRAQCIGCGACAEVCYAEGREVVGRVMRVAEVMDKIMRDLAFYDESGGGVTFSGGEPLLQGEFLLALLRACKAQDLHTTIDTCGYAPTETLKAIIPYVDLFLYDLKVMDDARHRHFTGASNARILDHLRLLAARGSRVIVRTPIIPGVNDDVESIRQIGAFVGALPNVERIDLLAYHKIGGDKYARLSKLNPMPEVVPPSDAHMDELKRILQQVGLQVNIGG